MRNFIKRIAKDLGGLALGAALGAAALFGMGASEAKAAELLMFEEPGCVYCAQWRREIGPIYPRSREGQIAPIRFLQKHAPLPPGLRVDPIIYTPTFVLVEQGREIGRVVGYPGAQFFWTALGRHLERLPPSAFAPRPMAQSPVVAPGWRSPPAPAALRGSRWY